MTDSIRKAQNIHAFPHTGSFGPGADTRQGMELRDYFAAAVLTGMGTWAPGHHSDLRDSATLEARAAWAYEQADAMLEAR